MGYPEPLRRSEVIYIDVSNITMKRGTYMQVRIPTPECSYTNPAYHVIEVSINDEGVISIHATPGTPAIQIWEDES